MAEHVRIEVRGIVPVAQGSKIAAVSSAGKPYMRETNDKALRVWRRAIRDAAIDADPGELLPPYRLTAEFVFPAVGTPRWFHDVTPDVDKLARATLDAITDAKVVWRDDALVVELGPVVKRTAFRDEQPGVVIVVTSLARVSWTLTQRIR